MKNISKWFFPKQCMICLSITTNEIQICELCLLELPWLTTSCRRCGHPLTIASDQCGHCITLSPYFQSVLAVFEYESPITQFINQFKFSEQLNHSKLFGDFLATSVKTNRTLNHLPTALIPVPLHRSRLRERGYNQSLEICKFLRKKLNIPILRHHCKRKKKTLAQRELRSNQRAGNVKNIFEIVKPIFDKHVAIVDDVMTTGHTVNELSRILRLQGVECVEVWCCVRARMKK